MKTPRAECGLKSSFSVSGKPKVPINELCARLQSAPFLHLTKASEPKIFSITESNGSTSSELQVAGNKLVFNYRFHRSSTKEYAKNLLKFLSILAYLGDMYEPELPSLYPSIMEILVGYMEEIPYADRKIENSDLLIRQAKTLSAMNCSLSLQILEVQAKCKSLELENVNMAKFSRDAIYGAMARAGIKDPNTGSLPKIIGTTAEAYKVVKAFVFEKKV